MGGARGDVEMEWGWGGPEVMSGDGDELGMRRRGDRETRRQGDEQVGKPGWRVSDAVREQCASGFCTPVMLVVSRRASGFDDVFGGRVARFRDVSL